MYGLGGRILPVLSVDWMADFVQSWPCVLTGQEDGFEMMAFGFDRAGNIRASALPLAVEFL
jgi:hypothetical protein